MDKHDELECVEREIFCIEEAIDYLSEVRNREDMILDLKDVINELEAEKKRMQKLIEAEDEREEAALVREYWRMVI